MDDTQADPKALTAALPSEDAEFGTEDTALASATLAATIVNIAPQQQWSSGDIILDDFQVEELLGEGGMGQVFAVRNRLNGQRFAVKRTKVDDPTARRAFLRELRTWLELPEHPNVVTCRFYRTVDAEIVVFAELVDGGSVADLVEQDGGGDLRTVLDIGIQTARGLIVAHDLELIHRDIKPQNVLVTADGIAKVTDFGLARAADGAGLVNGMTPAYASPEQTFGDHPVRYASDIWNLTVMLLELAAGHRVVPQGAIAGIKFPDLPDETWGFPLPPMLKALWNECLSANPDVRPTASEVASRLEEIWVTEQREPYPREGQRTTLRPSPTTTSVTSADWTDPQSWLGEPAADRRGARLTGRAKVVADLELFEEAAAHHRQIADTTTGSATTLVRLLADKAKVHTAAGDFGGARAALDEASERCEQADLDTRAIIATTRGTLARTEADYDAALGQFRAALDLRLAQPPTSSRDLQVAQLQRQLARTHWHRGEYQEAVVAAQETLARLEEIEPGDDVSAAALAETSVRARINLGGAFLYQDRRHEALEVYERVVEDARDLIVLDGRSDFRADLAKALFNLAVVRRKTNDTQGAIEAYLDALRIYEQFVGAGQSSHRDGLALTHANLAIAYKIDGDLDTARLHATKAIGIRERLVHLEGRRDLESVLATAYLAAAGIEQERKAYEASSRLAQLGIAIRERLVHVEGRAELSDRLAQAYGNLALWMFSRDQKEEAVPFLLRAIELREKSADNDFIARFLAGDYVRLAEARPDLRDEMLRRYDLLAAREIDIEDEIRATREALANAD